MPGVERALLLAPDRIARAAARIASQPEQRWMLRQPRAVRRSYVAHVLDRPDDAHAEQAWMLTQGDAVRESYVRDVLRAH
jgi:hypothetical protein